MDLNLKRQQVCFNETVYSGTTEQSIDCDITLPDYCPDILRILKCVILPGITSSQVVGERITAEGGARIRVLYVSETNALRSFEQNVPFSKYVEAKQLPENPCISVKAKTEYVNCRVVNQRRIDIHGSVSISINAVKAKQFNLIGGAEGVGIQLKCGKRAVSCASGSAERSFTLGESAEIGQSKPDVLQILRTEAFVSAQDAKVINNKILLKGSMDLKTVYCADTDESQPEVIEHSMPISQIIEVDGITEGCVTDICCDVTSLDVQPKPDSDGKMRLLDINARINVSVSGSRESEVPLLTDAYSTEYELETECQTIELPRLREVVNDAFLCRGTIKSESASFSKILDIWSGGINYAVSQEDGKLKITGAALISVIFLDSDGNISFAEKPLDIEYSCEVKCGGDETVKANPFITSTGVDFVLNSDKELDVRLELKITGVITSFATCRIITSLTPDEERPKNSAAAALTIYFSECGESVWGIARRYNTTVKAIMQENQLEGETINEKRMLLIPGV